MVGSGVVGGAQWLLLEWLDVLRHRRRVGVFRLQVLDDVGILPVAQPEVVVPETAHAVDDFGLAGSTIQELDSDEGRSIRVEAFAS